MPKFVDHEARRREIIDATWRIVTRDGVGALTMRRIAAEVGLANGALKHYFANRLAILEAAHRRVLRQTRERYDRAIDGRAGLAAIRSLCLELLPVDPEKLDEARVVIAFWAAAVADDVLAEEYRDLSSGLRRLIDVHVREARERGEITSPMSDQTISDIINWVSGGLQSRALLSPAQTTSARQIEVLDDFLASLAGRTAERDVAGS